MFKKLTIKNFLIVTIPNNIVITLIWQHTGKKAAAVVVVIRHLAGTTEIQTATGHVPHRAMLQLGSRLRSPRRHSPARLA